MMFQRSHFRTDRATSESDSEFSNKKGQLQVRELDTFSSSSSSSLLSAHQPMVSCTNESKTSLNKRQYTTSSKVKFKSSSSSSIRRLLITAITLRLTSSSTSTAVGTTSAGTLLFALLKSLLVACYYLLAFTSLLMLIFYINQFALSHQQQQQQQQQLVNSKTTISQEKLLMTHQAPSIAAVKDDDDDEEDLVIVSAKNKSAGKRPHLLERSKRSVQVFLNRVTESQHPQTITKFNRTTSSSSFRHSNSHVVKIPSPLRQTSSRSSSSASEQLDLELTALSSVDIQRRHQQQQLPVAGSSPPQLTFRHASQRQNESQWIPIVPTQSATNRQQQQQQQPNGVDQQRQSPTRQPLHQQAATLTSAESAQNNAQRRPVVNLRSPVPSVRHLTRPPVPTNYNHRQHHQIPHMAANQHHQRRWRRPRFNLNGGYEQPPISKMYKRVLLCDKTLVSLDYIRNPSSESSFPPFGHIHSSFHHQSGHFESDFNDNFIDLDTNLNQVFADRQHVATSNNSDAINEAATGTLNASASTIINGDGDDDDDVALAMERRSHLTDEDPLVKCDMWDLEKGLKNRKPPREILRMAVKADFDTVRDAINRCRQLSEKTLPPDDEYRDGLELMSAEDLLSLFSMKRGLMPGTKWCGLGDQASSYNDLGSKHRIDICCRAHDHCPIRLKPFRNDYGVLNIALYTKSHCDCDADFYRCLREAHSHMADMLGNLYFNVMKLQCMREERMKVCREMKPIALGFERCIRYEESPVKRVFKFTTPPVAY